MLGNLDVSEICAQSRQTRLCPRPAGVGVSGPLCVPERGAEGCHSAGPLLHPKPRHWQEGRPGDSHPLHPRSGRPGMRPCPAGYCPWTHLLCTAAGMMMLVCGRGTVDKPKSFADQRWLPVAVRLAGLGQASVRLSAASVPSWGGIYTWRTARSPGSRSRSLPQALGIR